ncbi:hypothetical protein U1Q18_005278 [Sarracenia purpurea var. burkii]
MPILSILTSTVTLFGQPFVGSLVQGFRSRERHHDGEHNRISDIKRVREGYAKAFSNWHNDGIANQGHNDQELTRGTIRMTMGISHDDGKLHDDRQLA